MRFVTFIWRLLVGVKDMLVLLFMLLFFGGLYAAFSASPRVSSGMQGALLLDLGGTIVEQPSTPAALDLLSGGSSLAREYRLRDVVNALRTAASDDRVEAVALDLDIFTGGGMVTLADVGAAIDEVRRAKKPVIAYASAYTDDSYQLAAHADEIWLNPMGSVLVRGPGGANLYYKGLMDKLGVTANVYRVGTYKAAVEPFTRNDMSPEARESLQAVAGSLWESWLDEIRRVRPKAQVAAYVAAPEALLTRSGGDLAKAALAAGLVDKLGDRTEFGKRIAAITGTDDKDRPGSFRTIGYRAWTESNIAGDNDGKIGVLTIAGEIVDGEADSGTAGAETIVDTLYRAMASRDLKALVVRVDSPGGSALGSERIRRAILDAKATGIPVVVSMGSVAASGGYWIATAGDHILAEPGTITGSIGVFGILPSFQGSLQKLGIGADGVKTTPLSGEPDPLRGPSPEAGRLIQASVEGIYRHFIALVSASRKLPADRVDSIAQGRIWDGGTARQLGLIDGFGSLDEAVAEAARRAKIDTNDATVAYLDKPAGFWDSFLASLSEEEQGDQAARDGYSRIAAEPRMMLLRALDDAQRLLSGPAIQARCLECTPASAAPPRARAGDRDGFGALLAMLLQ